MTEMSINYYHPTLSFINLTINPTAICDALKYLDADSVDSKMD